MMNGTLSALVNHWTSFTTPPPCGVFFAYRSAAGAPIDAVDNLFDQDKRQIA